MPPPQLVGLVVIDIAIQNQKAEEGNEEIINQQGQLRTYSEENRRRNQSVS